MHGRLLAGLVVMIGLASQGAAVAAPRVTVDLGHATVDGRPVLGRTPAEVTAAFGAPTWRSGGGRRLQLGYGSRPDFAMLVQFRRDGGRLEAFSVAFERQPLRETTLATNVLAKTVAGFATAVRTTYGDRVRLVSPRACRRALCSVTFAAADAGYRFTFGRASGPLGTYLTLWSAARRSR